MWGGAADSGYGDRKMTTAIKAVYEEGVPPSPTSPSSPVAVADLARVIERSHRASASGPVSVVKHAKMRVSDRGETMTIAVKAVYENGVFKPKEPVQLQEKTEVEVLIPTPERPQDDDPTGWKAAERFIGFIKDAPEGEPIARDHDKHLYK